MVVDIPNLRHSGVEVVDFITKLFYTNNNKCNYFRRYADKL